MEPEPRALTEDEFNRQLAHDRRIAACINFCRYFATEDMERIAADDAALRALVGIIENTAT